MSAPSPLPEGVRRDLERMAGPLAERMLPPRVTQSATTRNVVAAVNDDGTVDVMMGGAVMQHVPATTACVGVAVGDEVIVEQYGPRLYCVGVVARSLDSPDSPDSPDSVKQLWSDAGGWYMNAAQTARLSEPVSAQAHGIVLQWQYYSNSTAQQYNYNYTFVLKTHVAVASSRGVNCVIATSNKIASKYVYVSDDRIVGNANNAAEQTGEGGLVMANNRFVLTAIYGV